MSEEPKNKRYPLTDFGNAERVVKRYGHLFRYVPQRKQWIKWTGKYWSEVSAHEIEWLIKQTVRLIINDETAGLNDDERQRLIKHSLASEAQARIRATLESLKSQPGVCIEPEGLDKDHWLLNLQNGTLDLRTQLLRDHQSEDFITRILDFEYNAQANCPIFITFLDRIMEGNKELITFIQRVFGYCLTGDTREQVFFLFIGEGANGKSTLVIIMQDLLGSYAQQAPAELLIAKKSGGIPNEIAGLVGVRMAVVAELDKDCIFAEPTIKLITGGDKVRGRFLYHEYFEFTTQVKMFVVANKAPAIRGTDEGIWRRILWIPFNVIIPEGERDKLLLNKLRNEKSGILNWMLQGLKAWQEAGLQPPDTVRRASKEYRAENDSVRSFLAARCEIAEGKEVQAAGLFSAYQQWCEEYRSECLTQKTFGTTLKRLGYENRKKSEIYWQGISLKVLTENDNPNNGDDAG